MGLFVFSCIMNLFVICWCWLIWILFIWNCCAVLGWWCFYWVWCLLLWIICLAVMDVFWLKWKVVSLFILNSVLLIVCWNWCLKVIVMFGRWLICWKLSMCVWKCRWNLLILLFCWMILWLICCFMWRLVIWLVNLIFVCYLVWLSCYGNCWLICCWKICVMKIRIGVIIWCVRCSIYSWSWLLILLIFCYVCCRF